MAQKTEGIQQLLVAEKRASEKVSEARKRKIQKLKTAKKEADSEINKFKTERENQFKTFEKEIFGTKSNSEAQIQVQTNQKLKDQEGLFRQNGPKAMKSLQDALFDIRIALHENVKL